MVFIDIFSYPYTLNGQSMKCNYLVTIKHQDERTNRQIFDESVNPNTDGGQFTIQRTDDYVRLHGASQLYDIGTKQLLILSTYNHGQLDGYYCLFEAGSARMSHLSFWENGDLVKDLTPAYHDMHGHGLASICLHLSSTAQQITEHYRNCDGVAHHAEHTEKYKID